MYDVFVIANYDSERLRTRFAAVERYASVRYVFDRNAISPRQFPAAIRNSGHRINTDYYFVVRGDQIPVGDPLHWLRYDVEKPSVVLWPTALRDHPTPIPRQGLCLFPADATGGFEYEWVDETTPYTFMYPYLAMQTDNWQDVRRGMAYMFAPYMIISAPGTTWTPSDTPLVDQSLLGTGPNPILMKDDEVVVIPASLMDTYSSMDDLVQGHEWPVIRDWAGIKEVRTDPKPYAIVMLTNGETLADEHWEILSRRYPRAMRVDGVKGILNAHVKAAEISYTDYFWVIDADNVLEDDVDLDSFHVPTYAQKTVRVWRAENSINGLRYGYGGVKLFPTEIVRSLAGRDMGRDFTALAAAACPGGMTVMPECWSTTVIDSTPYEAWRAAYREVAKLSSQINEARRFGMDEHVPEMINRHRIWALESRSANGLYALQGAYAAFGLFCTHDPPVLAKYINTEQYIRAAFEEDQKERANRPELYAEFDERYRRLLREGTFWNASGT